MGGSGHTSDRQQTRNYDGEDCESDTVAEWEYQAHTSSEIIVIGWNVRGATMLAEWELRRLQQQKSPLRYNGLDSRFDAIVLYCCAKRIFVANSVFPDGGTTVPRT